MHWPFSYVIVALRLRFVFFFCVRFASVDAFSPYMWGVCCILERNFSNDKHILFLKVHHGQALNALVANELG